MSCSADVSGSWQDQYDLNQESIASQSMQKLLTVLKTIEKLMENQAAKEKARPAKQENKTDFEKSGKRKGMSSSTNRIPKEMKSSSDQFCQLCKEHGGPHTMHNTAQHQRFLYVRERWIKEEIWPIGY